MSNADTEILQVFGANLKKIRLAKGYTLRDVEAASNIDNGAISKIEAGKINITILTIVKLAQALEVEVNDLISARILKI